MVVTTTYEWLDNNEEELKTVPVVANNNSENVVSDSDKKTLKTMTTTFLTKI